MTCDIHYPNLSNFTPCWQNIKLWIIFMCVSTSKCREHKLRNKTFKNIGGKNICSDKVECTLAVP